MAQLIWGLWCKKSQVWSLVTLHPCFNISPFCLALNSGFQKHKFSRLPNPDFYTWGNSEYSTRGCCSNLHCFCTGCTGFMFQFTLQYSTPKRTLCFINSSLCSRRLKVMGARKNGVCPVLSCYFFLIISKHLLCRLYKQEICEKKAPDFNKSKNKILLLWVCRPSIIVDGLHTHSTCV